MENILKPKGMLCNRKLHTGQLVDSVDPVDIDWLTGQHTGQPIKISILQVKVDVYMKLLNVMFWSTGQQVDIVVNTQNMGKIMK